METGITLEDRILGDEEIHFYRAPLALLPWMALAAVGVGVGMWILVRFPESVQDLDLFGFSFRLPFSALIPLMLIGIVIQKLYDSHYVVGSDYVREMNGLFSLHKDDIVIEMKDIRGVEIDRSIYGRIVNTGNLKIGTSAHDQNEIIIRYIRDPSYYRDVILTRRKICCERER